MLWCRKITNTYAFWYDVWSAVLAHPSDNSGGEESSFQPPHTAKSCSYLGFTILSVQMSSSSFDESRPLAGEYESATQHIKHRSWRQRALMPLLLINATLTLTATVCLYRITSTLAQTKTTTQADCFDGISLPVIGPRII